MYVLAAKRENTYKKVIIKPEVFIKFTFILISEKIKFTNTCNRNNTGFTLNVHEFYNLSIEGHNKPTVVLNLESSHRQDFLLLSFCKWLENKLKL